MATITSVTSGKWSVAGTWDTGVPADGDTVVIASGHTVEFDVDQSGFADGIAGITITGTLSLTRTAGTYYMKLSGNITGAGTLDCGTSTSIIPFASKHTIALTGTACINGNAGLTATFYAAEPANKYIVIPLAEAAGQTRLEVGTDVTGDLWTVGDTVFVSNNPDASHYAEERIIGAIDAGYIDITVGLTQSKRAGSYIILVTRNLMIYRATGNVRLLYSFASGKLTIGGGSFYNAGGSYTIDTTTGAQISGGYFNGNAVLQSLASTNISGGTFMGSGMTGTGYTVTGGNFMGLGVAYTAHQSTFTGIFAGGFQSAYNMCYGLTINGGTYIGGSQALNGCTAIINGGTFQDQAHSAYGAISGCYSVIVNGGSFVNTYYIFRGNHTAQLNGGTFTNCNTLIHSGSVFVKNVSLAGITNENATANIWLSQIYNPSKIVDYGGTAGAFKSWTVGGIITSTAAQAPTGYTYSYLHALSSATYPAWYDTPVLIKAGETCNFKAYFRKDASMAYLPRVWVFEQYAEPLASAAYVLYESAMTDSTDTWETLTCSYTNATAVDKWYVIRMLGKNATGNVYSLLNVESGGTLGNAGLLRGLEL